MGDSHELPPPHEEPEGCVGPFKFIVEQITEAGNLDHVRTLSIGDRVEVRLDPHSHAAVFSGDLLIGWPSTYVKRLEDCLKQGYRYLGTVLDRRGFPGFPQLEVGVAGARR